MKILLRLAAWALLTLPLRGADFSRQAEFATIEDFVTAAKAFHPDAAKSDLAALFSVAEPGEANHGKPAVAASIRSCDTIWSGRNGAVVLVVAAPPTEATRSEIGLLIALVQKGNQWRIGDLHRFVTFGKEASVSAELTAGTGTGYELGEEGMSPIVAVKECHGGRGYAYQVFASYKFVDGRLPRLDLEER